MKKICLALLITASTLFIGGCSCGFDNGGCPDGSTYPTSSCCCGLNNGW